MKKPGGTATQKPPAKSAMTAAPAKKPESLPETTEGFPWPSSHEIKKESNPFTDRDWRMLAYAWAGMAVRVAIIFTLAFSVFQFLANQEQKRVEQTMSLVELWESKDFQQAQRALKERLAALNAKYDNLLSANPTPTEEQVFRQRIGIEAMTPDGGTMPVADFNDNFDRIVYFLNRLSICVEGKLCSRDVADSYFRDYAVSFWSYFAGYIEKERKAGAANYAKAIEVYVQHGSPPAAPSK